MVSTANQQPMMGKALGSCKASGPRMRRLGATYYLNTKTAR